MMAAATWTPIGVATRRVIEHVVVRNPHLAPIWIKLDRILITNDLEFAPQGLGE